MQRLKRKTNRGSSANAETPNESPALTNARSSTLRQSSQVVSSPPRLSTATASPLAISASEVEAPSKDLRAVTADGVKMGPNIAAMKESGEGYCTIIPYNISIEEWTSGAVTLPQVPFDISKAILPVDIYERAKTLTQLCKAQPSVSKVFSGGEFNNVFMAELDGKYVCLTAITSGYRMHPNQLLNIITQFGKTPYGNGVIFKVERVSGNNGTGSRYHCVGRKEAATLLNKLLRGKMAECLKKDSLIHIHYWNSDPQCIEGEKLFGDETEVDKVEKWALDTKLMAFHYKTHKCARVRIHHKQTCPHFHSLVDARRPPDKFQYSEKRCTQGVDECFNGVHCTLSHNEFEHFYHPGFLRHSDCMHWKQTGKCKGPLCSFYHPEEMSPPIGKENPTLPFPLAPSISSPLRSPLSASQLHTRPPTSSLPTSFSNRKTLSLESFQGLSPTTARLHADESTATQTDSNDPESGKKAGLSTSTTATEQNAPGLRRVFTDSSLQIPYVFPSANLRDNSFGLNISQSHFSFLKSQPGGTVSENASNSIRLSSSAAIAAAVIAASSGSVDGIRSRSIAANALGTEDLLRSFITHAQTICLEILSTFVTTVLLQVFGEQWKSQLNKVLLQMNSVLPSKDQRKKNLTTSSTTDANRVSFQWNFSTISFVVTHICLSSAHTSPEEKQLVFQPPVTITPCFYQFFESVVLPEEPSMEQLAAWSQLVQIIRYESAHLQEHFGLIETLASRFDQHLEKHHQLYDQFIVYSPNYWNLFRNYMWGASSNHVLLIVGKLPNFSNANEAIFLCNTPWSAVFDFGESLDKTGKGKVPASTTTNGSSNNSSATSNVEHSLTDSISAVNTTQSNESFVSNAHFKQTLSSFSTTNRQQPIEEHYINEFPLKDVNVRQRVCWMRMRPAESLRSKLLPEQYSRSVIGGRQDVTLHHYFEKLSSATVHCSVFIYDEEIFQNELLMKHLNHVLNQMYREPSTLVHFSIFTHDGLRLRPLLTEAALQRSVTTVSFSQLASGFQHIVDISQVPILLPSAAQPPYTNISSIYSDLLPFFQVVFVGCDKYNFEDIHTLRTNWAKGNKGIEWKLFDHPVHAPPKRALFHEILPNIVSLLSLYSASHEKSLASTSTDDSAPEGIKSSGVIAPLEIVIQYEDEMDGNTLARQIIWELHKTYPCIVNTWSYPTPQSLSESSAIAHSRKFIQQMIHHAVKQVYQKCQQPIICLLDEGEIQNARNSLKQIEGVPLVLLIVSKQSFTFTTEQTQYKYKIKSTLEERERKLFKQYFSQVLVQSGTDILTQTDVEDSLREIESDYSIPYSVFLYSVLYRLQKAVNVEAYISSRLCSLQLSAIELTIIAYVAFTYRFAQQSVDLAHLAILVNHLYPDNQVFQAGISTSTSSIHSQSSEGASGTDTETDEDLPPGIHSASATPTTAPVIDLLGKFPKLAGVIYVNDQRTAARVLSVNIANDIVKYTCMTLGISVGELALRYMEHLIAPVLAHCSNNNGASNGSLNTSSSSGVAPVHTSQAQKTENQASQRLSHILMKMLYRMSDVEKFSELINCCTQSEAILVFQTADQLLQNVHSACHFGRYLWTRPHQDEVSSQQINYLMNAAYNRCQSPMDQYYYHLLHGIMFLTLFKHFVNQTHPSNLEQSLPTINDAHKRACSNFYTARNRLICGADYSTDLLLLPYQLELLVRQQFIEFYLRSALPVADDRQNFELVNYQLISKDCPSSLDDSRSICIELLHKTELFSEFRTDDALMIEYRRRSRDSLLQVSLDAVQYLKKALAPLFGLGQSAFDSLTPLCSSDNKYSYEIRRMCIWNLVEHLKQLALGSGGTPQISNRLSDSLQEQLASWSDSERCIDIALKFIVEHNAVHTRDSISYRDFDMYCWTVLVRQQQIFRRCRALAPAPTDESAMIPMLTDWCLNSKKLNNNHPIIANYYRSIVLFLLFVQHCQEHSAASSNPPSDEWQQTKYQRRETLLKCIQTGKDLIREYSYPNELANYSHEFISFTPAIDFVQPIEQLPSLLTNKQQQGKQLFTLQGTVALAPSGTAKRVIYEGVPISLSAADAALLTISENVRFSVKFSWRSPYAFGISSAGHKAD